LTEATTSATESPPPAESGGPPAASQRPDRVRRFFLCLIVLCVSVAVGSIYIALDRDILDTSDEAGYSAQADSLMAGDGLTIGFIQFHHKQVGAGIEHPEDLYPPGTGALQAVAYTLLGKSEFAAVVPSILLQCLVLPFLAFFLARRLGAAGAFAFACGMAVLFDVVLREAAFQGLSDLPFSTFMLAAALMALRSRRACSWRPGTGSSRQRSCSRRRPRRCACSDRGGR